MPKRLQRKRTKGWRKPEGAVIVDRTSRWGNPFKWKDGALFADISHLDCDQDWQIIDTPTTKEDGIRFAIVLYKSWVYGTLGNYIVRPCEFNIEDIRRELAGKDLLCFCSLYHPCHADVLLELANT